MVNPLEWFRLAAPAVNHSALIWGVVKGGLKLVDSVVNLVREERARAHEREQTEGAGGGTRGPTRKKRRRRN